LFISDLDPDFLPIPDPGFRWSKRQLFNFLKMFAGAEARPAAPELGAGAAGAINFFF
jgi:hypothetical protein